MAQVKRLIGIHLAVKNNVTSAGWLKLFEVTAR